MKIAIVTLNGYFNYGNRLQNYALQETLKSLGNEIETIINDSKFEEYKGENRHRTIIEKIANIIKKSPREAFKVLEYKTSTKIRTSVFKKFTYDYIKETNYTISENNIPEDLSERYDYFVTGSDQVWNPLDVSSIYFLTFAEKHKRIAYAPSFGISELKPELIDSYKEWISGINMLSIREDDGARIIKKLTGRDVPVLVDPTLLLTREKWLSIAKAAKTKPKEKYILTYFLGGIPDNYKKQLENVAKENKMKIINLGDIDEKESYRTGPSEFIDYINSCSLLCTDSFHGAVFSILFEKPFIVYERIGNSLSMYSRINTLLEKFNLNSRKVENIKNDSDFFNIDYSHVTPILEEERQKSFIYLRDALNIKGVIVK